MTNKGALGNEVISSISMVVSSPIPERDRASLYNMTGLVVIFYLECLEIILRYVKNEYHSQFSYKEGVWLVIDWIWRLCKQFLALKTLTSKNFN